jgi:DNA uptake protein ComE-like DNA-binding protein
MKNFLATFFTFTSQEKRGLILLCILLFLLLASLIGLNFYNPYNDNLQVVFNKADTILRDSIFKANDGYKNYIDYNENKFQKTNYKKQYFKKELSIFDPNVADSTQWKKLGLYDNQIRTIKKYIAKGGHFYKPEDVLKIRVVKPEVWEELLPYIVIEKKENNNEFKKYDTTGTKAAYELRRKTIRDELQFEINICTRGNLFKLELIDSAAIANIISYRKALGGFVDIKQLYEIKGIDTTNFSKLIRHISIDKSIIKTYNINYCSSYDLSQHPYMSYSACVALINYRSKHGKFQKISDIKNCAVITESLYKKIEPYLILVNN